MAGFERESIMSLADSVPQRVALYARVSTEDQADRGTIQAQIILLRNLAQAYGWDVVGEYIDDGISGTIPLDERPEGRRLLDDARAGRIMILVAYRLDRVGRSLRALLDAHDSLEGCGVTIRSATEPFDTSTPIGKFLFQLLASLAELEKSTISERMNMGRDRVAREGKWTGGWIPYGYQLDASRRLVPSSHRVAQAGMTEAEVARQLYTRIADGSSLIEEARRLNALGIPSTRRHGAEADAEQADSAWSLTRVARIIHSPRYRGTGVLESRFGRIETEVPALVSAELWDAAQAQLLRNRSLSTKNATHRYLLRGLVTCGNCGLGMTGHSMGGPRRSGKVYQYYRCCSQLATTLAYSGRRCHAKFIGRAWLEEEVWADCRTFILNPGDALAEAQQQLRTRLSQVADMDDERRRLEHLLAGKEAERERVMTLFRRGRASLADAEAQLDAIEQEGAVLRDRLDALRAQDDLARVQEARHAEAGALLARLASQLEEIERDDDWDAKRRIVETLVDGITVTTSGEGRGKRAQVEIRYVFGGESQAVASRSDRNRSWPTTSWPP